MSRISDDTVHNTPSDDDRTALRRGTISALSAYLLWGVLPVYWKQLDAVPAVEILMHRILWSGVFMTVITLAWYRSALWSALRRPRSLLYVAVGAVFITINWFIFTYSVVADRLVEVSLGYYINPLVSVLLGVIVLGERLTRVQMVALGVATVAVVVMAVHLGVFPWISLGVAFSFGLYGLFKKIGRLPSSVSLTMELFLLSPVAAVMLVFMHRSGLLGGVGAFGTSAAGGPVITVLLVGAGAVTAVPLLLFGAGATRIPLSRVGFLQYVAPTLMLLLGTVVYGEPFTIIHAVSFVLIWTALAIYTATLVRAGRRRRAVRAHAGEEMR